METTETNKIPKWRSFSRFSAAAFSLYTKGNWLVLILVIIGIIDILLRCWFCKDFSVGLKYALHDPGKSIFHLLILPSSVAFFLGTSKKWRLQESFRELGRAKQIAFIVFSCVVMWCGLSFTYDHENYGRCNAHFRQGSFIMPYDVKDTSTVRVLIDLREKIYDNLSIVEGESDTAKLNELKQARMAMERNYQLLSAPDPVGCSIFTVGTIASVGGLISTLVAVVFVGVIICTITLILISRIDNRVAIDQLMIVIVMMAPWVMLRIYSESYINFTHIKGNVVIGIVMILIVLIILLSIGFFFRSMSISSFKRISIVYTTLASIFSIAAALNEDYIRKPFMFIYGISPEGTIFLFIILLLPLVVAIIRNAEAKNLFDEEKDTSGSG